MNSPSESHRRPSPAAILIIIPLVVALVLTLFAWPSARLEPRDVPVGVAGAPAAATAIERQLAARDGAFETHRYADEAAAREAIEDREVYGAFVATPSGAKVLTATAASPAVAQLLNHAAAEAEGARRGRRLRQPGQRRPRRQRAAARARRHPHRPRRRGPRNERPAARRPDRRRIDPRRPDGHGDHPELARRDRRRLARQRRRAQPHRALGRRDRGRARVAARQGGRGARGADHGADRQPVLGRRHRPGDAADGGRLARSAPARGRRRQPGPQHRPVRRRGAPAATSRCSPSGRSPGSPCCSSPPPAAAGPLLRSCPPRPDAPPAPGSPTSGPGAGSAPRCDRRPRDRGRGRDRGDRPARG